MKKSVLSGFSRAFIALALLIGVDSCKKPLDDDPKVIGESVVKTDEEAFALVNGSLGPYQTLSSSFSFLVESSSEGTVSFEGEESEAGPEVSRFEVKSTNWYPVKVFNRLYKSIGITNDAIEKINGSAAVSAEAKKVSIARAKFLRGLYYSYLVQFFGEVPLVLETGKVVTKRSAVNDVYTQIVKDLTEAEANLPEYDSSPINPSKGSANAILSRVYLNWGSVPLTQEELAETANLSKDTDHIHVEPGRLNKAVDHANKVINSGKYRLLENFNNIFGKGNESKAPEHIFTIRHDGDGIDAQGNHQSHCSFTFAFELEKDNHIGPSNTERFKNWDPADKRREYSYTTVLQNPLENNKTYTYLPPITLPRYGKFIDRTYANGVNLCIQTNEIDRIEIRYAEVLLVKAEALVALGRNGEAVPVINQIRERAFGNGSKNLSAVTVNDIRKEWANEFTYEQKDWFNLVRWKTLVSSVKTVKNFEYFDDSYAVSGKVGKDGNVVSPFFAKVHKHLHAKYDNVRGKHYRFPIPTGEKGEDLGIKPQNPGY